MRARPRIPFRTVNRRGTPGHDSSLQRHHLLPLQLLGERALAPLLLDLNAGRAAFDDFRHNGMLLPASERSALSLGLPLHRGPHRAYNEMVIERMGSIERDWSRHRGRAPHAARHCAQARLISLQHRLRAELAQPRLSRNSPFALNRRDPIVRQVDYSGLDAMADLLWGATESIEPA